MKKKLVLAITILVIIIGGILFTVKQQVKTSKQNEKNSSPNSINSASNNLTDGENNTGKESLTDKYGYKNLSELPQDYTLEQAIEDRCVVITYNKVWNKDKLDSFIENTGINSKDRKEDKIRIAQTTVEGDLVIKDLEYKIKDETYKLGNEDVNKTTYILTEDNTRDKFSAEADRKITVNEITAKVCPSKVCLGTPLLLKKQNDEMIHVVLGLYAIIDYVNEDVPRYENIEVCAYRKIIEDSEATIMEE